MSPQTKRQIYLPGGGGGGGSHGGSQELSIQDRLGTSRLIIADSIPALNDQSSVSFSSPETLAALLDSGTLIYSDFQAKGALQEFHQLLIQSQESNFGLDDSVFSVVIKTPDTLGAQTETQSFSILVTDTSGAFTETAQFQVTQQETNGALTDSYLSVVNLASIDSNAALTETLKTIFQLAETLGALQETSTFTLSLFGNAHAATSGWTNPANAIDNSVATAATLTATATGVLGATNVTANASSDIDFPDIGLPSGFTVVSAALDVYSKAQHMAASTTAPGSGTLTNNYSLNSGGAYTALTSRTGSGTNPLTYWDDSVTPNTFSMTGIITTGAQINGFRYRAAATAVSGATGATTPSTVLSFFGVVLRLTLTG